MEVKTKSSYTATYYVINGGVVDKLVKTLLSRKDRLKRGYKWDWCFHMSNVPPMAVKAIQNDTARCKVHLMAKIRNKIKREIVYED